MTLAKKHLDYNKFAWFYNQYWGDNYCKPAFPCIKVYYAEKKLGVAGQLGKMYFSYRKPRASNEDN